MIESKLKITLPGKTWQMQCLRLTGVHKTKTTVGCAFAFQSKTVQWKIEIGDFLFICMPKSNPLTFPTMPVAYPAFFNASANVVSFAGSPPTASDGKTPPVHPPAVPDRIGSLPVNIAARDGEQTWKAEYLQRQGREDFIQWIFQRSRPYFGINSENARPAGTHAYTHARTHTYTHAHTSILAC